MIGEFFWGFYFHKNWIEIMNKFLKSNDASGRGIGVAHHLIFKFFKSNFDAACFCFFNAALLPAMMAFNVSCVSASAFSYAFNNKKHARFNGSHLSICLKRKQKQKLCKQNVWMRLSPSVTSYVPQHHSDWPQVMNWIWWSRPHLCPISGFSSGQCGVQHVRRQ